MAKPSNYCKVIFLQLKLINLKIKIIYCDPADVGNLISSSSAFSKTSLNIRKFTVHILLKPGLENFEHYFTINSDVNVNTIRVMII